MMKNLEQWVKRLEQLGQDYRALGKEIEALKAEQPKPSGIDWTEMPVDTLVEVSQNNIDWYKRYFHSVNDDNEYCCYPQGKTSFSYKYGHLLTTWKYIRRLHLGPKKGLVVIRNGTCGYCAEVFTKRSEADARIANIEDWRMVEVELPG